MGYHAGSGLLALLAVVYENIYPFIPAAISIVSLSLALHFMNNRFSRGAVLFFALTAWFASILYELFPGHFIGGLLVALGSGYVATALAIMGGGAEAGLSAFGAIYAPLLVFYSYDPMATRIFSAGYLIIGGLMAGLNTGRAHIPFLSAILAIPILLLNANVIVSVSLLAYISILSVSGAVEWRTCPFTMDSGLIFMGIIVGLAGVAVIGLMPTLLVQGLGLYVLGLLLQLAGILTPVSFSRRKTF
jgi:hypothetical protein